MKKEKFCAGKYELTVFQPDGPYDGAIYIPAHGNTEEIISLLPGICAALVFIDGFAWNKDLSPWPAKAVFGDADFDGRMGF